MKEHEDSKDDSITKEMAFDFQNHFVLHLLSSDSIPVPRLQVFSKLKIGESFKFNEQKQVYEMDVSCLACVLTQNCPCPILSSLASASLISSPNRPS